MLLASFCKAVVLGILFIFVEGLQAIEPYNETSGSDIHNTTLEDLHSLWNVSENVEIGPCSVTCGIGVREFYLTAGCPENESRCVFRVEDCREQPACGWGEPLYEDVHSVKLACIYIPPPFRFSFEWNILENDQEYKDVTTAFPPISNGLSENTSHETSADIQEFRLLSNTSYILDVERQENHVIYECETYESGTLIASVKFTVYNAAEVEERATIGSRQTDDIILVIILIVGVVVVISLLFGFIFLILNWKAVKNYCCRKCCRQKGAKAGGGAGEEAIVGDLGEKETAPLRENENIGETPAGEPAPPSPKAPAPLKSPAPLKALKAPPAEPSEAPAEMAEAPAEKPAKVPAKKKAVTPAEASSEAPQAPEAAPAEASADAAPAE